MSWKDTARRHLLGTRSYWGDQHVIRPIRVPTDDMPAVRGKPAGRGQFQMTACGPKPWSDPVNVAVSVLRGYFCREFGTGPYIGYEGMNPYLIYVPDDDLRWVIGAMDFDYIQDKPHFCWAWIHPEFRDKGTMTAAVQTARDELGEFTTEKPISPPMLRVLAKIGHPDKDWSPPKWTTP